MHYTSCHESDLKGIKHDPDCDLELTIEASKQYYYYSNETSFKSAKKSTFVKPVIVIILSLIIMGALVGVYFANLVTMLTVVVSGSGAIILFLVHLFRLINAATFTQKRVGVSKLNYINKEYYISTRNGEKALYYKYGWTPIFKILQVLHIVALVIIFAGFAYSFIFAVLKDSPKTGEILAPLFIGLATSIPPFPFGRPEQINYPEFYFDQLGKDVIYKKYVATSINR